MVESVYVVTIIYQIMESMNFQTYKSLRYDPKKVIHQRNLDVNLAGYEAEQDEVLATLANTDLLEKMGDDDIHSSSSDRINLDIVAEVPTPLKGEKSLKGHSIDTVDMEIDITTKKPRVFVQSKEIVDLEEDDKQSISKGKGTIVEEEHNDQSQAVSNSEKSSSHLAMVETNKEPSIMFQRFTLDQAETSQFHSKEELVKDFIDKRNKSTNENYKLMQEIRRTIPVENSLLVSTIAKCEEDLL